MEIYPKMISKWLTSIYKAAHITSHSRNANQNPNELSLWQKKKSIMEKSIRHGNKV